LLRLRDSERLAALDALRGAAILLVLGRHYHFDPGWVGVDLFFVLSGFLVSGLLFREYQRLGRVRVGRFLARRGFKIYPAFYAFMLVTAIYMRHTPTPPVVWVAECLFLQGYLPHIWSHTWSLAVEEHFYLLLALGLALIVRRGRGAGNPFAVVVPATAIVALAELAARILTVSRHPGDLVADLYPTHLRLDSLLFGVLLSYWYHFDGERLRRIVTSHRWIIAATSVAAVVLVMAMDVTSSFTLTVGLTLLYLGFGGALLLALMTPMHAAWRPLAWIGTYSYAIYLWHVAILRWAPHVLDRLFHWAPGPLPAFAIYVGGALGVGVLMTRLIERPFLTLRDRWIP